MSGAHRLWRASGAPARALLLAAIRLYRATLSGVLGGQCRFYPTCSHYAEDAIRTQGALKGSVRAAWRVLRCNPFGRGGLDPVMDPVTEDGIIQSTSHGGVAPAQTLENGARG
ncbi:MAG TPA: membrane protein insertion efficiency factor YidD [Candidatus Limnocylindrales bacterium]|nr:membrane protein insertion efficiency factor YidD [Candidatus Limnocylindrales bacterium]